MESKNDHFAVADVSHECEEDVCGICFTSMHPTDNPRGRLNSCDHLFCAYCISEWAQSTNVCPHCKARFTRIFSTNSSGQEVVTKVRRRNYRLWEAEEETASDDGEGDGEVPNASSVVCRVCGDSDSAARMILCDRRQCDYAAHLDCLRLAARPGHFFCATCTALRGASVPAAATPRAEEPPAAPLPTKVPMRPPAWLTAPSTAPMPSRAPLPATAVDSVPHTASDTVAAAADAAMQLFLQRCDERAHSVSLRAQRRVAEVPKRPRSVDAAAPLLDPAGRAREEERLARRFAHEMMPVLHRNQAIQDNRLRLRADGAIIAAPAQTEADAAARSAALYAAALAEGWRMARESVNAKAEAARVRAERIIRIRAEREAAALAKLAKIIASHRNVRPAC